MNPIHISVADLNCTPIKALETCHLSWSRSQACVKNHDRDPRMLQNSRSSFHVRLFCQSTLMLNCITQLEKSMKEDWEEGVRDFWELLLHDWLYQRSEWTSWWYLPDRLGTVDSVPPPHGATSWVELGTKQKACCINGLAIESFIEELRRLGLLTPQSLNRLHGAVESVVLASKKKYDLQSRIDDKKKPQVWIENPTPGGILLITAAGPWV